MSNQSRSQVIAHVSARRNRCTAFECNAQHTETRQWANSGPHNASATMALASPKRWVLPQKPTRSWAAGTAALLDTVCFFSPVFRPTQEIMDGTAMRRIEAIHAAASVRLQSANRSEVARSNQSRSQQPGMNVETNASQSTTECSENPQSRRAANTA